MNQHTIRNCNCSNMTWTVICFLNDTFKYIQFQYNPSSSKCTWNRQINSSFVYVKLNLISRIMEDINKPTTISVNQHNITSNTVNTTSMRSGNTQYLDIATSSLFCWSTISFPVPVHFVRLFLNYKVRRPRYIHCGLINILSKIME